MGAVKKKGKISAASARAHTRKNEQKWPVSSGVMIRNTLLVFLAGCLAWIYQCAQPPPPNLCGPPITAPRIALRDGRHLAYKENGVPKEKASHKFIFVHGFDSFRNHAAIATHLSPETAARQGIYIVSFDRPGYGESDPDPKRTEKSIALDIEELADHLGLGQRFYVVGFSMGGQVVWGCLKYIPHRLAGATLLAPVVNYWWPGFPSELREEGYKVQLRQDQWALRVAHYAPWFTYWWNTQNIFPGSSVIEHSLENLSSQDKQILASTLEDAGIGVEAVRQQGVYESLHRDMMVGFGRWGFDPMNLTNPFPNNEATVHLWQGDEDRLVPAILQRFIAQKLPWIQYHELKGAGHMFPYAKGMSEAIIKQQLSIQS